jgi:hypothetical protein
MLKQLMKRFEEEFVGQSKVWEPVNDSMYCGRISDAELEAMRGRNQAAIKKSIEQLGSKWLLHPDNQVFRHESK